MWLRNVEVHQSSMGLNGIDLSLKVGNGIKVRSISDLYSTCNNPKPKSVIVGLHKGETFPLGGF
ncbi:hypothetical protein MTR67_031654 [Solanum verrucosum]|uniref:Uncharacterized protein n=1 Tax=Solanum verrucosum TaxID=315347 RepID=A0AAF0ZHY2_SOLVR|nr:hypothetical protein MTR67_031654 [Solanum verrucosum]